VSRHENQPQRGEPLTKRQIGIDCGRFLGFLRAAGDKDPIGLGNSERSPQLGGCGIMAVGRHAIELNRPGYLQSLPRSSQRGEAFRVGEILDRDCVQAAQ
jgi:hypothetical protein